MTKTRNQKTTNSKQQKEETIMTVNNMKVAAMRTIMALLVVIQFITGNGIVAKAAEAETKIEIIGDIHPAIERGQDYVEPGYRVTVNDKEVADLTKQVKQRFFEVSWEAGKKVTKEIKPFNTLRIAEVEILYYLEGYEATSLRYLTINDQNKKDNSWSEGQIAAQKAYVDAEKQKDTAPAVAPASEDKSDGGNDDKSGDGKKNTPTPKPGTGGGDRGDGGDGGSGGGTPIPGGDGDDGSGGSGGSSGSGGGGDRGDEGDGGNGTGVEIR